MSVPSVACAFGATSTPVNGCSNGAMAVPKYASVKPAKRARHPEIDLEPAAFADYLDGLSSIFDQ